jgi:hypothetical protein
MRKVLCAVALLALVTPAFAASSFAGTWKINLAKSTGPEPTALEQAVAVEEGDGQTITVTGKSPDGTPFMNKFSILNKGGTGKIIDATPYTGVTAKPITANTQDFMFTINGKPATHVHSVLSSDGKTMTSTVRVMAGSRSKPGLYKDVWDKQ